MYIINFLLVKIYIYFYFLEKKEMSPEETENLRLFMEYKKRQI